MPPGASTRPLAVGIVGCGRIADAHVEQARAVGAEVVAVCDQEPLMAQQLGDRLGIEARHDDLAAMLSAHDLDVVHVTTPPAPHPELVATAVEAGCHVVVEKPIAVDAAAAEEVVGAARRADRLLAVNHWYDFEPVTAQLDRLIAEGVLGDLVHVESVLGYDLGGDYGLAAMTDGGHWVHGLPGKLVHNVLDHVISPIARLLPDPGPRVHATGSRRRPAVGDPALDGLVDEVRFLLDGDVVSGYGMVSGHARPLAHELRVYGTERSVRLDLERRTLTVDAGPALPSALGRLPQAFAQARQLRRAGRRNVAAFARGDFHFFEGMRRLLDQFYEAVRTDGPAPVSDDHLLRVARWIDAVLADLPQGTAAGEGRP